MRCLLKNHKVSPYSLWAWICTGVSAPLGYVAAQNGWLTVLLAGAICGALCYGVLAASDKRSYHAGWYSAVQTLWIAFVSGVLMRWSARCWPTAEGFPIVGVTLLVLAVFAAWGGACRASRCGGALFWLLALLYAVILVAGTQDLKLRYMVPEKGPFSPMLVMIFLIPAVAGLLPCDKHTSTVPIAATVLFATVVSLWTVGTLSARTVAHMADPFYEFSRSLSLFGVAERFESIASVALTMGYFALLSLLLSAAHHLTESIFPDKGRVGVAATAALALAIMLFATSAPEMILMIGSLLFWVLLPVIVRIKSKNNEIYH